MMWREALTTLRGPFEAKGGEFRGLHHVLVEVGDHERERAGGPDWLRQQMNRAHRPDDGDPWQTVCYMFMIVRLPRLR